MKKVILIKYGELTTKKDNRNFFINKLKNNIFDKLSNYDFEIRDDYYRMFIFPNEDDIDGIVNILKNIFGIHEIVIAYMDEEVTEDSILKCSLEIMRIQEFKTFKVVTNRSDKKFPIKSMEMNNIVGGHILKNIECKVDVHNPDIYVWIEIRKDCAYLMLNKIAGAGGYPVGIQGKVMMMLSGGIDSPVAAYLLMKRGVYVEFVHFASPPYTSQEALNKVLDLAKTLTKYQSRIRVHVIDFTKIQLAIYKGVPESYAITMMRRYFLRIANMLSEHRGALAIGNGENLGQVASQTLHSMEAITQMDSLPILRPLLTYDKVEIIDLAKKIETYETSILPFEDCCTIFTPKNPVTKPKSEKVNDFELKLDLGEMIVEAVENREIVDLKYHDDEVSFL